MSILSILDISIGLVFTFLILSLLSAEIQEQLATIFEFRAVHLKRAIRVLFGEYRQRKYNVWKRTDILGYNINIPQEVQKNLDNSSRTPAWINQDSEFLFLDNPDEDQVTDIEEVEDTIKGQSLIRVWGKLIKDDSKVERIELSWGESINVESLTDALYESTAISGLNQFATGSFIRIFRWRLRFPSSERKRKYSEGPSNIPPDIFATAVFEVIQTNIQTDKKLDKDKENLNTFLEKIHSLPFSEDSKRRLTAVVKRIEVREDLIKLRDKSTDQSLSDLERIHHEIADWFEQSINHSSGVYKRNAKGLSFLIGIVISVLFNINTFNIIHALKNQPVNSALNESAVTILNDQELLDNCISEQANPDLNNSDKKQKCSLLIQELSQDLQLNLPVLAGWDTEKNLLEQLCENIVKTKGLALIGWIITALAISMGSPFWFQILGKIINVRNSTAPKDKGNGD